MLVTCIHCSDFSAEGILKIVSFFGYLVPSYYGFTCFCLVGVYHGPVCSHCFCVKHSTLSFGQYNHVSLDSDWLLQRINWCPCTLLFSDMRYRQKWNLCHAVLLRWLDVHLIKTLSLHIRIGIWLKSEFGSTCMAGSVRNLSCCSNTGQANINIHDTRSANRSTRRLFWPDISRNYKSVLSCTDENNFHPDGVRRLPYPGAQLAEKI